MHWKDFEFSKEQASEPAWQETGSLPATDEKKRQALDDLFTIAYEELKRIAGFLKLHDGSVTLNPTALVREAWLKLARSSDLSFESPLHFKRVAARAMRQILKDAARRRSSLKRGGDGGVMFVTLGDLPQPVSCDRQFLILHDALNELERLDARQALMVECRFFGGFDVDELVEFLNVSEATILRDWKAARAFLAAEIRQKS